jgi:tRNA nucleotidyltransferase (CCA-adding enzyme)
MVLASPDDLVTRLRALPAGARLLAVLDDPHAEPVPGEGRRAPRVEGPLPGISLVGGAVRDLLLGREPHELDLVVEGDAQAVASELGRRLRGAGRAHELFGTHTIEDADSGLRVDVAMARAEEYPEPGALPVVRPAALDEDLLRRDFTVNAIALGLSPERRGELKAAPEALADLEAGRLRVLHDRSFLDDPTRLIRLVRYAPRLGFAIEPRTEELARAAFAAGAPATAGVARMGNELQLLLGEPTAIEGLLLLRDLAGPGGLGEHFDVDPGPLRAALALLPADGRRELLLLAGLARSADRSTFRAWLEGMHVRRPEPALDAQRDPVGLASEMADAPDDLALHRLLRSRSPEAVALAGAYGAQEPARRWFDSLRHVKLDITGDDLVAAGVPQGPEIGRRLDAALGKRLNEGVTGRDAQLAAALAD